MGNPCAQIVVERKDIMSGKTKIIGISVLVLILLAGTAMAQRPGGWSPPDDGSHGRGHEMGPGPGNPGQQIGFGMENLARFRMMFRHLDLTEEQVIEIEFITEAAREEAMAIMEAAGRPEDQPSFMEIFTSPTLTISDLEEAMGKRDDIREAMEDVLFEAMVDVHNVLTVEQLDKLAEMVEEHAGGMGQGPGMEHSPIR